MMFVDMSMHDVYRCVRVHECILTVYIYEVVGLRKVKTEPCTPS